MDAIFLIIPVAFLVIAIIGVAMEKRLRTKYNGAVGLVNSFLFTGGLFAGIMMIVMLFSEDVVFENTAEALIAALICVALAVILFILAWRKCPAGCNSVLSLIVAMFFVGAASYLHIFGFIMKLVFHFDMFAGTNPGVGYANWYQKQHDSSASYQLWTVNGSYAVLKGSGGNLVNVRPHGSDGLVCDDSNNLYEPV